CRVPRSRRAVAWPARTARSGSSTSPPRPIAPRSRATSGSPKPPTPACRPCNTTATRAAPSPTWRWRAKSCARTARRRSCRTRRGRTKAMAAKRKGLGRGLDALLGTSLEPASTTQDGELRQLPVEFLQRGRYQPRTGFDPAALQELADSIKAQGIVQPIVARPLGGTKYEIIAGERRWRAAQLAGLAEVPVLVRDVPDEAALAVALIENIQRED